MEQQVLSGLLARGIPLHIAQGMVANMIAESGLKPGINEAAPVVPGSRGGYGLNQWTGPRRRQFEAYASERGAKLDDLNTQLDFTLWELQNTERNAFNALSTAGTAEEAARIYSDKFLRPGIPHLDRRLAEARRLAGMGEPSQGQYAPQGYQPQGYPQQPENALAPRPELKLTDARMDPTAFMTNSNAFAAAPVQFERRNYLART